MLSKSEAINMKPLDLINIINFSEGEIWRLKHDVGHGRITRDEIAESVIELETQRNLAYKFLEAKTGIKNREGLIEYSRSELDAQEKSWDLEWGMIHQEGVVFRTIADGHLYKKGATYEVLGAYLAQRGCSFNEVIIARSWNSDFLRCFNERDVPGFEKIDAPPRYFGMPPEKRGWIKVDEGMDRRVQGYDFSRDWKDFDFTGEFVHSGFGKFSTDRCYNKVSDGQDRDKEIILARPRSGQGYYVEFSRMDLPAMTRVER